MSAPPLVPGSPAPPLPVLGSLQSRWSPPADGTVTTHSGAPLPADLFYIAAPPTDDIGVVVSAYSTVRANKGGDKGILRRIGSVLVGAWLGIVVIAFGGSQLFGIPDTATLYITAVLVGGIPGFLLSAPENGTTYVCQTGAIKYIWGGKDNPLKGEKWFRYSEATDLLVSQTRHYTNGIYTGTEWSFLWRRREPETKKFQEMFRLGGRFYRSKGPADNDETFHFGTALEAAYSKFHLARSREILASGGSVPFSVGMNGMLAVSAKGLQVSFGSKQEFISRSRSGMILHSAWRGDRKGDRGALQRGYAEAF